MSLLTDLYQKALGSIGQTFQPREMISPVPQQAMAQVYQNDGQRLQQQFEDSADMKDALQAELKYQPMIDAQKTAKASGWVPQKPVTLDQLSAMKSPARSPQVLGANTGGFEELLAMAADTAKARGFHPAPIASQMAAESARGTSRFAKERNNYFGIGAFDSDLDNTWRFNSPEESVNAYLDLFEKDPRYAKAYEQRGNPEAFVNAMAPTYASDPNYSRTIMNTPEWRRYLE